MIDFSWSHILILLIVALVVVGPKDLPRLMRIIGQWTGKARKMADEFRRSFDDMARQSELDELRKELDELRTMRPLAETQRQFSEAMQAPKISLEPEEQNAAGQTAEARPDAEPAAESGEPAEPVEPVSHPPPP